MTGSTEYTDPYPKLVEKYNHLFTKTKGEPFAMFGFECGDGWYKILEQLISHIDHYFTHKYKGVPEGFAIIQVKEKFGGLRFYVHGGDAVVHELINFAENLADNTCEFCGSNQHIMRSQGWIVTACEECTKTRENLQGRKWVKAG